MARLSQHTSLREEPIHFQGGFASGLAKRLHSEFIRNDTASELAMEGLALELLAEVCRGGERTPERSPPRWLLQARERLKEQFATHPSIEELAAAAGVHPVHFARTFRRHFGCTPGEFVRTLRIEHACRLLATSGSPLTRVALSAGFADQSHLTKTFRRSLGTTPGEFRRRRRSR